jgi:hypothetical protein
LRRLIERRSQAAPFLLRSGKARPAFLDMRTGARSELPASSLAAAQCAADFSEVETEHVVQQKARALERRQPFEHQHQRDREVVREIARRVGVERLVHDRFGQPLADIYFATRLRRFHSIETQTRHHGAEIMARLFDCRVIRRMPAQVSILHDVLGLGARAEHAVGKTRQRAPMGFEGPRIIVLFCLAHAARFSARTTGRVSPPIVTRVPAGPWPIAYFKVG